MKNEFSICYKTFGDAKDPCIILIAGIGGQLIDWPHDLTQGLADHGFYVVTFDNRDSGLSRYYDELGDPNFSEIIANVQQGQPYQIPYSLEDMATDVITLMDHLNIQKAHILGMSMGGIIAQFVALNFRNRANSLICIATTSGDPSLPPAKKEVMEFFSKSLDTSDQTMEYQINRKLELFKIYNHPDYFDEEKTRDKLITAYKRAHNPVAFKRLMLATMLAKPRTELLNELKIPCLIIHGSIDPLFSIEHAKQLAECIDDSHLEIIENMGHGLPDYFVKKVVDVIINYLRQLDNSHE